VNCKACNTRLPAGGRTCPHCGHAQPQGNLLNQNSSRDTSPPSSESGASSGSRLSPSNATSRPGVRDRSEVGRIEEEEVELPLEDAMAIGRDDIDSNEASQSRRPIDRRDKAVRTRLTSAQKPRTAPEGRTERATGAAAGVPTSMDAEAIRHMIGEQPDLLEPGLRVLGEEGRRRVGIGYGTEVGEIDLLARSDSGDWVVVMVADGRPDPQLVPDVLHRVGWVRKHLCEKGDSVRAILLLEGMSEELGYAAAAVANTIDFRTWRVSIQFESIEV